MKKLLLSFILLMSMFHSRVVNAQVYAVPITFHVMDHGADFTSFLAPGQTIEDYLANLVCDVNKTFAGTDPTLTAAITSGVFPSMYVPLVNDSHIRFYIDNIEHIGGYHGGGAGVPKNHFGYGINVYLYNYYSVAVLDPVASYVQPSAVLYVEGCHATPACGLFSSVDATVPCCAQTDVIMMSPAAFTGADPRGTLCHEIGHYLSLVHLDGSPSLGTCTCPTGSPSVDCAFDTPPAGLTYYCNMGDVSGNMSQNCMQMSGSCQVFFTPDQVSLMQADMATCRSTLSVPYMVTLLASHPAPPVLGTTVSGYYNVVKASYPCGLTGMKFRIRYYIPGCDRSGFYWYTRTMPSTLFAYGTTYCGYHVEVIAIYPDGFTYNYPDIGIPPAYPPRVWCPCFQDHNPTSKSSATNNGYHERDLSAFPDLGSAEEISMTDDDLTNATYIDAMLHRNLMSPDDRTAADFTDIELYPNPASERLIVKNANINGCQFVITNVAGKTMENNTVKNSTIDVKSLTPGNYFVKITDTKNNVSKTLKFSKL